MTNHNSGLVHESDLFLPILRILAQAPNGFLETSELIAELEALFKPDGRDAETLHGRNDTYFSQKVRNVVSHRDGANSPVTKGWIDYHVESKGLKITEAGQSVLESFS